MFDMGNPGLMELSILGKRALSNTAVADSGLAKLTAPREIEELRLNGNHTLTEVRMTHVVMLAHLENLRIFKMSVTGRRLPYLFRQGVLYS